MSVTNRTLLRIDKLFLPFHYLSEKLLSLSAAKEKSEHVVVIKFMGMGSLVLFARLCEQNQIDKTKITLLTFSKQKEVCEFLGLSYILIRTSDVFVFIADCLSAIKKIKNLKPSLVIDYERCSHAVSSFRNIISVFSNSKSISFEATRTIISLRQKIYSVNNLTYHSIFMKGIEEMPIVKKENKVQEAPIQRNKVLININASDYLLARRYSLGQFADLINSLYQWNDQLEFHLTGSSKEIDYVGSLVQLIPNTKVINEAGQWTLKKLASELATCQLFVTCDSGPLHLAAYLNVDTISIWGPTQPKHFGYESHETVHSVSLDMACSPCFVQPFSEYGLPCNKQVDCLKNLNAKLIFNQAIKILSSNSSFRSIPVGSHIEIVLKNQGQAVVY